MDDPGGSRPYWQQFYGVRRLYPTARGRRGCLFMLFGALAVMILLFLILAVSAIGRVM